MIVRREVFEQIGLLDEKFFLYFDDVDFCMRAWRAGFECWSVPQSRIMHLRGQTTGLRQETWNQSRRPAYWYESRRYFFEKHHGWWYATASDAAVLVGTLLRHILSFARGKVHPDPPHHLRNLLKYGLLARGAYR
jgi:GT2 family glycosyltransferase